MKTDKRHPEIVLPPGDLKRELQRRSRRGFLVGGLAAVAGVGSYEWLTKARQEDGAPWPQRRMLGLNEKLARGYLSDTHLMPSYPASRITYLKPNGDIGVDSELDKANWRLKVAVEDAAPLELRLSDVMALPKIEMITRFCCIEGWSVVTSWAGARFSDFTRKFFLLAVRSHNTFTWRPRTKSTTLVSTRKARCTRRRYSLMNTTAKR